MRATLVVALLASSIAFADLTETLLSAYVEVHHMELDKSAGGCRVTVCAHGTIKETGEKRDLGCVSQEVTKDSALMKGCAGMTSGAGLYVFKTAKKL